MNSAGPIGKFIYNSSWLAGWLAGWLAARLASRKSGRDSVEWVIDPCAGINRIMRIGTTETNTRNLASCLLRNLQSEPFSLATSAAVAIDKKLSGQRPAHNHETAGPKIAWSRFRFEHFAFVQQRSNWLDFCKSSYKSWLAGRSVVAIMATH